MLQDLYLHAVTGIALISKCMDPSNIWVRCLPAIFNARNSICAFLLQQSHSPVNVVAIQPVVVDAQGVFKVLDSVMPSAWNKYGLPSFL